MRRRFSYADQKNQQYRSRWKILVLLIFFFFYISCTSLFFSMRVMENDTMVENLQAGERFVFSSYSIYSLLPEKSPERALPFRRGNVVLVDMFREKQPGALYIVLDGVLRFFTFQRFGLIAQEGHVFVKRVIGLPGDEITMTNFVIRVKTKGSAYYLTEFEVTETDYTPAIPHMPALWDASLPFSGNLDTMILGENECFVLSDDRSNTNDSRTWGPVPVKNISGKALFRYWPFTRFGRI